MNRQHPQKRRHNRRATIVVGLLLRTLCTGLLILTASTAIAEEKIPVNMAAWPVGVTAYYQETPGDIVTETYLGREDGLHKFRRTFTLSHNGRVVDEYLWKTDNLEVVREQTLTGAIQTFMPHNCARTLGPCQMTVQLGSDRPRTYSYDIERTADGYTGTFTVGDLSSIGSFELDANGFLLSTHRVADDGTVYKSRRVKFE